jgi:hypothetical protein
MKVYLPFFGSLLRGDKKSSGMKNAELIFISWWTTFLCPLLATHLGPPGNDEITLFCVSLTLLAANDEDKICGRVCTIKIRFSQWAISIFGARLSRWHSIFFFLFYIANLCAIKKFGRLLTVGECTQRPESHILIQGFILGHKSGRGPHTHRVAHARCTPCVMMNL